MLYARSVTSCMSADHSQMLLPADRRDLFFFPSHIATPLFMCTAVFAEMQTRLSIMIALSSGPQAVPCAGKLGHTVCVGSREIINKSPDASRRAERPLSPLVCHSHSLVIWLCRDILAGVLVCRCATLFSLPPRTYRDTVLLDRRVGQPPRWCVAGARRNTLRRARSAGRRDCPVLGCLSGVSQKAA